MDPVTYVSQGEDDQVDRVFVEKLEEVIKKIYETFKEPVPMIFDVAAKKLHESQHECYACGEEFDEKKISLKRCETTAITPASTEAPFTPSVT